MIACKPPKPDSQWTASRVEALNEILRPQGTAITAWLGRLPSYLPSCIVQFVSISFMVEV